MSSFPDMPLRVCLLGFEPLRGAGLQAMFSEHAGIDIVLEDSPAEGASGWLDPTLAVVVVGTQTAGGTLKLIASIRSSRPGLPVVVMSPATGDDALLTVLSVGAKGFLHETCTAEQFEEAVRAVTLGSIWAPRRILAQLIERLLSVSDPQNSAAKASFTARERQVMDLLLEGQPNREIASRLKIEERTVKAYVARLMRKMGVKNRTALSMRAISADQG